MTDDGSAPTIPDTNRPTPVPTALSQPSSPDSRYALRTLLGRGGMGEVWLAHDGRVDREIAVKVMRGGTDQPDSIARFLREARIQGRLEHPNVVPVHDVGVSDKAPYFAMKRLAGTTLADIIAANDQTRWPRRMLLARFVDICLAMEFAHQRGVVHRDLKPTNIMLGDFGEAYVLDWGLAHVRGDSDAFRPSGTVAPAPAGQTEAGVMLGTPGYMSPEQMRGEPIDQRTDVYALGCILFEILAGKPANGRASAIADTLSTAEHRPSVHVRDIPPELDAACALATTANAVQRLESARLLADRVQKFLDGDRDVERRRELAKAHVDKATASFQRGDAGRAEAMREAGSAIALDAENRDAQALLARLLLEPPQATPPAVREGIDAERSAAALQMLRWIVVNYMLFFVAIAVLYAIGVSRSWPVVLLAGELLALSLLCFAGVRHPSWIGRSMSIALTIGHCVLLASICVLLGPVFLGPSLIFGSATVLLTGPILRVPILTVVLHVLIIGVPLGLELVGVLPRTVSLDTSGALVLKPWAIEISQSWLLGILLGQTALQLIGNALVLHKQRVVQDQSQELLHVQAWQLKQLVRRAES
jgi:eukaryotic-like serine/threonine-protein kinase